VLFTDVVGSTELRQSLGDDAADEQRREHDRLLRTAVAAHAGTEVKGLGDGLMVVFDSAADGVAAAVAIQRAIHRLARRVQGFIQIRVGLSAGDVSWEGDDCFGTPVVEAARLCAVAAGGRIVASDIVRVLAGTRGGHQFVPAGPLELKNLGEPVTAFEVTWESVPVAIPLPPPLTAPEQVAFVGRGAEVETLAAAWRSAAAGDRRIVLLAGEPGIGKTRLAGEAARAAHEGGGIVLFGRCDEDLGVPFQPFVEALGHYAVCCPVEEIHAMLGPEASELVRLVPELSNRLGEVPATLSSDPETERYRLFEAVARLLARITETSPVVLVLDDLHWAAKPTLLMLRHVLHSTDPMALLIVVTYRDTELGRSHPLAAMLADFHRDTGVQRLAIGGLDQAEVAGLAEAIGARDADVAAVHAETDGNPFFAGQVLRHLSEAGPNAGRIPEGVREVVGRRLARLSGAANEALAIGAVMGREFELTVIEACGGPSGDGLVAALDETLHARVVDEVPGTVGRYSFAHALIRQTLYDELSMTRRVRLHWRIGEAVEARPGPDADARLPELAHHFVTGVLAGDAHRAAMIAVRAGDRSRSLFAHEDAGGLYLQAAALLDAVSDSDPDLRFRALTGLGWTLLALGDTSGGESAFLEAASLARDSLSPKHFARAVIGYSGTLSVGRTDVTVVATLLDEAIAGLGGGDSPELSQLLSRKSRLGRNEGRAADAEMLAIQALDMARRLDDKPALASALEFRATTLLGTPGIGEAVAILDELDALGENQWQLANLRSATMFWLGDRAGLDAGRQQIRRFVDQQGTAPIAANALRTDGCIALAEGRWADAKALAAAARDRVPNDVAAQLAFVAQVTIARREQGRAAELVDRHAEVVRSGYGLRPWASLLATMYCDIGALDAVLHAVESFATDEFADVTMYSSESSMVLHHLAEATATLRHVTLAAGLYDLVLPYSSLLLTYLGLVVTGAADRSIGQLATVLGRYDEAEERYEAALALERNFGARALVPRTQYWYARLLAERDETGDRTRAKALLDECVTTTAELGMSILERQAREVLATV